MARTAAVAREAIDSGLVTSATVLDGGSTDRTADIAVKHGIDVLHVAKTMTHLGEVLGKGDSLFRGIHSIDADWFVFLDADLGNVSVGHIQALTRPIGTDGVVFVKGGFVRVDDNGVPRAIPGGRVTETVVRPVLATVAPDMAALSQPLSGQVAIRADVARKLSVVTGYGVEIAMLIDIWREFGPSGIREADMGVVQNRFKPNFALNVVEYDVRFAMYLRGLGPMPSVPNRSRPDPIGRSVRI